MRARLRPVCPCFFLVPSFWRENVIVVVILLRAWAKKGSGGNKLSNGTSFVMFWSREDLNFFNKNNRVNFSVDKKWNDTFWLS